MIRRAGPADVAALAALHAEAFQPSWDADALGTLLAAQTVIGVLDVCAPGQGEPIRGLLILRCVADEAEILTLAVHPDARRTGRGGRLLEAALAAARELGARRVFLEVAADNVAALRLYQARDFEAVGRRRGYYARAGREAQDALVLAKALSPP